MNNPEIELRLRQIVWDFASSDWSSFAMIVEARKVFLSNALAQQFNNVVNHGLFRGMTLPKFLPWGESDRGSMLLGLYEKEVLEFLATISKRRSAIVLGAGFGYYGVGLVRSGIVSETHMFEISTNSRSVISEFASLNQVQDRCLIYEDAFDVSECVPLDSRLDSVILCDIEGAEFDLFSKERFFEFSRSIIVIEVHDFFFSDGEDKLKKLIESSSQTHSFKRLTMGERDLQDFVELSKWHDHDRWLLCSESRGQLMNWIVFLPMGEDEWRSVST